MITINARGARTLADARPLTYAGTGVYVTTDNGTAQLHLGGHIVAERPAAEVTCTRDAQDWAYDVIEAAEELIVHTVADEDAVAEATDVDAVYAGAAETVQASAQNLLDDAARLGEHGTAPYRFRNSNGRWVTFTSNDPRHPAKAADTLRKQAAILAEWTARDEAGYRQYLSDGLADTDGHYAPLDRPAWYQAR